MICKYNFSFVQVGMYLTWCDFVFSCYLFIILRDSFLKVCEEYRLHRETFYLAIDFIDRYLSKEHNIPKDCLQLVGVTSLFVAAKLEVSKKLKLKIDHISAYLMPICRKFIPQNDHNLRTLQPVLAHHKISKIWRCISWK